MFKVYLLTGTNLGDREKNLGKARGLIAEECGKLEKSSGIYETAAWGKTDQHTFLNQALLLRTALTATQLMPRLLKIEKMMGRERMEKYGPRLIDIDILLFDEEVHEEERLRLPHPAMQNRRFALVPLNDIAPYAIHPVLNKTISQLLEICPDPLGVKKFNSSL